LEIDEAMGQRRGFGELEIVRGVLGEVDAGAMEPLY
jgi:hypothetical protein